MFQELLRAVQDLDRLEPQVSPQNAQTDSNIMSSIVEQFYHIGFLPLMAGLTYHSRGME